MPQLPITVNASITRIDAPFPEQWQGVVDSFVKEVKAIQELMATIAISLTSSQEAQNALANLYTKESVAERASQAIAKEQSQQRPEGEEGNLPGASRPKAPEERQPRNPSKPPGTKTPYEETEQYLNETPIALPQHYGGKYTTPDILRIMAQGTLSANQRLNEGEEGTGLAKATEYLHKGATKWVPTAQAGFGILQNYSGLGSIQNWSPELSSYAGSLGYEPGGGFLGANNLSVGPMNFRVPMLNSAALSGLGSMASSYGKALTVPGLSGSQVMAMNQSLAERGWFPGQKGQQELLDTQAHLIGKGGIFQQLGENPEVSDLLDRAMRSGTAGTKEMVRSIEEIPEAAKHAHEGVSQMVQSMNAFGEFSQSQGGTHYAGQQQALELANMTGIPNSATKGLMESPWAQSAIFRATGTPSWMQGTVPGSIKNQAVMQGFWSLSNAVGKGTGRTYRSGGFEEHVSSIEEQAARMHMLLPNMNPETIQRMLREGKRGVEGRNEVQKQAEMWEKTARGFMGTGKTSLEDQMLTASNVGKANFGRLLKNMEQQKTEDGKPMFSREDIKDIRSNFGQGYDGHGNQLLEEKYKAIQEVIGTKAGKSANAAGSPGNVVLELSPAARKLLQLPNKRSRIKVEAGAGENSTVNGFSGYTDGLLPVGGGMGMSPNGTIFPNE